MTAADRAAKAPDEAGILRTWAAASPAARALLLGMFVNRLGAFIQVFLVLFMTDRGFTTVQAGTALGVYGAGSVGGVLVGGTLTDRLGPRRTVLISMTGGAVLVLAILYLRNYAALLVAVALAAAVSQGFRPASSTLLSLLTAKHQQVMIFAMYRFAMNLGGTAAPLLGAVLVAISYDLLFWGEALAALAYAIIAAIALPRGRGRDSAPDAEQAAPTGRHGGYIAVLADRRFVVFLVAAFLNAVVYIQYLSTLPIAMRAAGLGTTWYGALVALNAFIVITCELLVTKVVQRWPMRIIVTTGFLLLGGGLAWYAVPLGAAVFIIGTLTWSLAEIVAGPTIFAYPAVASPERLRGRYIAAFSAVFNIGFAVGPIVGLAVWELAGTAVWWWCGVVCLLGAALAWWGMRTAQPSQVAST